MESFSLDRKSLDCFGFSKTPKLQGFMTPWKGWVHGVYDRRRSYSVGWSSIKILYLTHCSLNIYDNNTRKEIFPYFCILFAPHIFIQEILESLFSNFLNIQHYYRFKFYNMKYNINFDVYCIQFRKYLRTNISLYNNILFLSKYNINSVNQIYLPETFLLINHHSQELQCCNEMNKR